MAALVAFLSSRQNKELNGYRKWASAVLQSGILARFFYLWRFEDQAASGRLPEAIYLQGVASSRLVIFIAGSDTSDATIAEISESIRLGIDIICLILPSALRTDRLLRLIERVREIATTKDVLRGEAAFKQALEDSLFTWLEQRVNGASPQRRGVRLQELFELSRQRSAVLWRSAGVDKDMSLVLADDRSLAIPLDFAVPTEQNPFKIVVAPAGAGKSLTVERMFQSAIRSAQLDIPAPIPVRLTAHEMISTLNDVVLQRCSDLGSVLFNGVTLLIDSLDEVELTTSRRIISDAAVFQRVYAKTRVALFGRQAPDLEFSEFVVELPALSHENTRALLLRVGGSDALDRYNRVSGTMASTIRRPLFALVFASNSTATFSSENELADALIDRALSLTERAAATGDALQVLSASILDSSEATVEADAFSPNDQLELLKTRLVYKDKTKFRIPIRLVAERAAAQWLSKQSLEVVVGKAQLDYGDERWRTSLITYIKKLPAVQARKFIFSIAKENPVLAMRLAEADNSPVERTQDTQEMQLETVEAIRIFAGSFQHLYSENSLKISTKIFQGSVGIIRERLDQAGQIVSTATQFDPRPSSRHSVLLFAARGLIKMLDEALSRRSFFTPSSIIAEEEAWNDARILLSTGKSIDDPIQLTALEECLITYPYKMLLALDGGIDLTSPNLDFMRGKISALRLSGETQWNAPFVIGDRPRGKWLWSSFSDSTLLAKRRNSLLSAMAAYQEIVTLWLPKLKLRLEKSAMMPAVIKEHIFRIRNGEPCFSHYWTALPKDSENEVDVSFGEDFMSADTFDRMREAISCRKAEEYERYSFRLTTGLMGIENAWPVRELAYACIHEDLKALGLSRTSALQSAKF